MFFIARMIGFTPDQVLSKNQFKFLKKTKKSFKFGWKVEKVPVG